MWPPSSEDSLFARRMIATAFQRIAERILCSSSRLPGDFASCSGGIVLQYGVVAVNGGCAPVRRASSRSCSRMKRARSTPWCWTTARKRVDPLLGLDRIVVVQNAHGGPPRLVDWLRNESGSPPQTERRLAARPFHNRCVRSAKAKYGATIPSLPASTMTLNNSPISAGDSRRCTAAAS